MRSLLIALILLTFSSTLCHSAEPNLVLIVVGPSKHPPGSHEVAAGGRLLSHCIDHNSSIETLQSKVVYEWPDEVTRKSAATVVFIGDTFPPNRFPNPDQNLRDLAEMMDRGCGIICLHYATGLLGQDVAKDGSHPLLQWMGGYFANRSCPHHESIARIYEQATISPAAAEHPLSRGWSQFTIHDEPYINNYFGPDANTPAGNVTPIATSMLPPDNPQREIVAWATQRPDGGRGFGVVMPHFYKNWQNDNLRTLILNAVVWSAGQEIPEDGIESDSPILEDFKPEAVEFVRQRK